MCCRTRIRTSTNWTKTSCAAITPYDSPPKRVCKYTFFYFCTNTQTKKYARLIKILCKHDISIESNITALYEDANIGHKKSLNISAEACSQNWT